MLLTFLLAALRNLLRHKLQAFINIVSLAIGLAVFSIAFLYVKQELSYDRGWPDGDRVHRLLVDQRGIPGEQDMVHDSVPASTWALLPDYFSADIEVAARSSVSGVSLVDADSFTDISFVDPQFLDIFQFEVVDGDLRRAVAGPGFVAMEEQTAAELGMVGRIGERVTFKGFGDGQVAYELAAIYRMPQRITRSTTVSMLTLMHDYSLPLFDREGVRRDAPWDRASNVWLKLKPGVSTEAFNAKQADFIEQQVTTYDAALGPERAVSDHLFHRWQPLSEIHFNPNTREMGAAAGDPLRVAAFALVGLLVLLVGCSNSISLSLAAALERRREIGVRKAAGALPREIMQQQLSESLLKTTLALLPALVAVELLSPVLQALLPTVSVSPSWSDYALLAVIAALVGLACGIYPALVLSKTRPQAVLRAGAQPGKSGMSLRTLLVAAQFCFASLLLIVTAALYVQLAVARLQPLGFDPDNMILLDQGEEGAPMDALRVELEKVPGIVAATAGPTLPPNANLPLNFDSMSLVAGITDTNAVDVQALSGGLNFIDFMRMRIIAGRDFDAALDAPNAQPSPPTEAVPQRIIINVAAARALGFTPEEAVDRRIYQRILDRGTGEVVTMPLQVLGVMEDSLYLSLRRRPDPVVYMATGGIESFLMLRYDPASEDTIQQTLHDTVMRVHGRPPGTMDFVDPQIEAAFKTERNESKLLLICGGIALVLASIGLYGLAAFALEQEVKEVGVRKVMGAEVRAIVGLYLWRFARPIIFASVVAWPLAAYFVTQWIERFPYQMERAWLVPLCIATLAGVLTIALLTVGVMTTRAATAKPVRSLRCE